MDYNKKMFLKLLAYKSALHEKGKSIRLVDHESYIELLNYAVILEDYLHWQERNFYLELMKNFVSLKITENDFELQFYKMFNLVEAKVKLLENNPKELGKIEPDLCSRGFSELVTEIYSGFISFNCEFGSSDLTDLNNFRNFIQDLIPKIEKYK